jgi:hypothetical protein
MVAPSFVRDIRDPNLLQVWNSALEAMRQAEKWVIIGYSMPAEDIAIRSMFIRAFHGHRREPQITVVQRAPEPGQQIVDPKSRANYRMLFPKCAYREIGVMGFVEQQLATARKPIDQG